MTTKPLRVSFVIQKLFGLSGGAERVFLETARAMAARGMHVDILIYDNGSGQPAYDTGGLTIQNLYPRRTTHDHVTAPRSNTTPPLLKKIPHQGIMGHAKWALTHGLFARRLQQALQRKRPDLVVAFLPPAITAAVHCGQKLGIPTIASIHNLPEMDFEDSPRWDQNPVYRRRARAALSQADAITVLQDSFRDWFPPDVQDRVHVIGNPISRLSPPAPRATGREKLILGVGRLTDVKRYDLLIAAWAKLYTDYPDWRIDIYGEGPLHGALSAQISAAGLGDSLRLCGTTDQIGHVYDRARLLCHPAAFEGFGLVVAEAMAHGTPALAFASCTGVNQLVQSGENGILIDTELEPVKGLCDALRRCLDAPEMLQNMGLAAQSISDVYAPDVIASHWDSMIRRLIA